GGASARGGIKPERDGRNPDCARRHENNDARAGKIEANGRDDDAQSDRPEDPAFAAVPNVVLGRGQNQDGSHSEKIGGLIAIEERGEDGERYKRGINQPAGSAASSLENQAGAKESDDDPLGPRAGRATEKNRKNRQQREEKTARPLRRHGMMNGVADSRFFHLLFSSIAIARSVA